MKNRKYQTVGIVLKTNSKIVERVKIDNPNTQIHDCSISWLGTLHFYRKQWDEAKISFFYLKFSLKMFKQQQNPSMRA